MAIVRFILILLLVPLLAYGTQTKKQIQVIYLHHSVGLSIYTNCINPFNAGNPHHISDSLHTIDSSLQQPFPYQINGDTIFAEFIIRQADKNGVPGARLGMTTYAGNCGERNVDSIIDPQNDNNMGQYYTTNNTGKIWSGSAGNHSYEAWDDAIDDVTDSGSNWLDLFRPHYVRNNASDTSSREYVFYDMVVNKNPYACWLPAAGTSINAARITEIKNNWRKERDSILSHPEIPMYVSDFGTPPRNGQDSPVFDSTQGKLVLELFYWHRDTFLTEVVNKPYRWNYAVSGCYDSLVELSAGVANRYCIKTAYNSDPAGGAHLTDTAQQVAQRCLIRDIVRITRELLKEREWRNDHQSLYGCLRCSAPFRARAAYIIALRSEQGISGDNINEIEAIRYVNRDFEWLMYLSGGDGYGDDECWDSMSTWMIADGKNPEDAFLHYIDSTIVTECWNAPDAAHGGVAWRGPDTCAGLANATTLADTIDSRVRAYAQTFYTRFLRNWADADMRTYMLRYLKWKMNQDQADTSATLYYSGVAWDNGGYRFGTTYMGNTGSITKGGHVAEVPYATDPSGYRRVDSITAYLNTPNGDTTWYWASNLRVGFASVRALFDTAANWHPTGKDLKMSINTAGYWVPNDDLHDSPYCTHYYSHEFTPTPFSHTEFGAATSSPIFTLFNRDTAAWARGMAVKYNPQPVAKNEPTRGTYTREEVEWNEYGMYLTYAGPTASLYIMRGDASNGLDTAGYDADPATNDTTGLWDTLTWAPGMNFNPGIQHNIGPYVDTTLTNSAGAPMYVFGRDYTNLTVRYCGIYGSSGIYHETTAVKINLPDTLRELLSNGTITTSKDTCWIRPGESRLFLQNNNLTFTGTGGSQDTTHVLNVSPGTLNFSADSGAVNPATQNFTLSNSGGGTLSWTVSDNQTWISCSPTSGTGNSQSITVTISTTDLAPGTYNATITCSDPIASNTPVTVGVSYVVNDVSVGVTPVVLQNKIILREKIVLKGGN